MGCKNSKSVDWGDPKKSGEWAKIEARAKAEVLAAEAKKKKDREKNGEEEPAEQPKSALAKVKTVTEMEKEREREPPPPKFSLGGLQNALRSFLSCDQEQLTFLARWWQACGLEETFSFKETLEFSLTGDGSIVEIAVSLPRMDALASLPDLRNLALEISTARARRPGDIAATAPAPAFPPPDEDDQQLPTRVIEVEVAEGPRPKGKAKGKAKAKVKAIPPLPAPSLQAQVGGSVDAQLPGRRQRDFRQASEALSATDVCFWFRVSAPDIMDSLIPGLDNSENCSTVSADLGARCTLCEGDIYGLDIGFDSASGWAYGNVGARVVEVLNDFGVCEDAGWHVSEFGCSFTSHGPPACWAAKQETGGQQRGRISGELMRRAAPQNPDLGVAIREMVATAGVMTVVRAAAPVESSTSGEPELGLRLCFKPVREVGVAVALGQKKASGEAGSTNAAEETEDRFPCGLDAIIDLGVGDRRVRVFDAVTVERAVRVLNAAGGDAVVSAVQSSGQGNVGIVTLQVAQLPDLNGRPLRPGAKTDQKSEREGDDFVPLAPAAGDGRWPEDDSLASPPGSPKTPGRSPPVTGPAPGGRLSTTKGKGLRVQFNDVPETNPSSI